MIRKLALFACIITLTYAEFHTIHLHAPSNIALSPIRCYYKGERFDVADQWALIPENKEISFTVIITEQIQPMPAARGNTINYFKRDANIPCIWLDLTKKHDETNGASWHIVQKKDDMMPVRLPHDALIIHMNPICLESTTINHHTHTLQLNLHMKPEYTQTQVDEIILWSHAAALDTETFHRRIMFSEKENCCLALPLMHVH